MAGNEYLQEAAPWASFKRDPALAAAQIRLALNLIRLHAVLSAPFLPETAARLFSAMKTDATDWPGDVGAALETLAPGHGFEVPELLFAKVSDEQREAWETRFAGAHR